MKWSELPKEIQERMLYEQELQGNPKDESVFINYVGKNANGGGFNWDETTNGFEFWDSILYQNNINLFYEKYPKSKHEEMEIYTNF